MRLFLIVMTLSPFLLIAQEEKEVFLTLPEGNIYGTLTVPVEEKQYIVLFIPGSGSTDRNMNGGPMLNTNSAKMMADSLAEKGIASLRYDKRGIGKSSEAAIPETDLLFNDNVMVAEKWMTWIQNNTDYKDITILGHSEGSLIGILTAQNSNTTRFISISGPGEPAHIVIRSQLETQPDMVKDLAFPIMDSLVAGKIVEEVNPMLLTLFRPSIQPYLISWFSIDPTEEIKKLDIPVLIISGGHDIQVDIEQGKLLEEAAGKSALHEIFPEMNHIWKNAPEDMMQNVNTYTKPELPLTPGLITAVVDFINK